MKHISGPSAEIVVSYRPDTSSGSEQRIKIYLGAGSDGFYMPIDMQNPQNANI